MKKIKQRQQKLQHDCAQVKEHFKMYKVGRTWLFAGLLTVSLGAGIAIGQQDANAQVSEDNASVTAKQAVVPAVSNQAVLKTSTQDTETSETDSDSSTTTPSTEVSDDVQMTNLGVVDSAIEIDQAKKAAEEAYQTTGKVQTITATSPTTASTGVTENTPTQEAVNVKVDNATKVYDNKNTTPVNYTVTLSDNLTAPSGWYLTDQDNEYLVDASSADLDLSQVGQDAGTYNISLSSTGLQRLNAVAANQQKNLTVSSADVTPGKLTIIKAPVATGSVLISGGSKRYDNNPATDPSSYKVSLAAGLKAPADWVANGDGTYTIPANSTDLAVGITSQQVGQYQINLSAAGLQKLMAANKNDDISSRIVTAGIFTIENNNKLIIGTVNMNINTSLPDKLTVAVSRSETVPTDWQNIYDNSGQDSIVYSVPIAYFDTSAVNPAAEGTYAVTLSSDALATLNTANSTNQIAPTNIQTGQIVVVNEPADVKDWSLANFGGRLKDKDDHMIKGVLTDGSVVYMTLPLFNNQGTPFTFTNLTEFIIVPTGLVVADSSSTTTNGQTITSYTKANDPAKSVQDQLAASLTEKGMTYSNFKVTQLANYNGRQTFAVQFGSVDLNNPHFADGYPVALTVDPNLTSDITVNYGNRKVQNDAAILYATDSYNWTNGSYKLVNRGDYPNILPVATALGVTDAVTINDFYDNSDWTGSFTIVHGNITDTYHLTDEFGTQIADPVTIIGKGGDIYNPLQVVPEKINTSDGLTYVLDTTSLALEQQFKGATGTSTSVEGSTYTVKYKLVLDSSKVKVQVNDKEKKWDGLTPNNYTVTLPAGLKAPSTWFRLSNGSYSVDADSGDLDLSAVKPEVGSYPITLSKQGLAKLLTNAYLFDNQVVVGGTLTITPVNVLVNVLDTSGNVLKPQQKITLGGDQDVPGANASAAGYSNDQLVKIVWNYDPTSPMNSDQTLQQVMVINHANNTVTSTTTYADPSKPAQTVTWTVDQLRQFDTHLVAGESIGNAFAQYLNDLQKLVGFGQTPTLPAGNPFVGAYTQFTSWDIVYQANTPVNDHPGTPDVPNVPNQPTAPETPTTPPTETPTTPEDGTGIPTGNHTEVTTDENQTVTGDDAGHVVTETHGTSGVKTTAAGLRQTTSAAQGQAKGLTVRSKNETKAETLPQTNEHTASVWQLLGLSLMSLLGLAVHKKRKED